MERPSSKVASLLAVAETLSPGLFDRMVPPVREISRDEAYAEQNKKAAQAKRARKESRNLKNAARKQ